MANELEIISESEFHKIENILNTDEGIRRKVINKLNLLIDDMNIDINSCSSKVLESQMGVISTMDSLMKSIESGQFNLEKLKAGKVNNELAANIQEKVTALLSSIIPTQAIPASNNNEVDIEQTDVLIEAEFKESDLEITNDETSVID